MLHGLERWLTTNDREATQGSPKQDPWENHPLCPSIKRWLNEAGPFCALHLQRARDGRPESNDALAYITSETFEDVFGSAPTQKEVEHALRQSKVCYSCPSIYATMSEAETSCDLCHPSDPARETPARKGVHRSIATIHRSGRYIKPRPCQEFNL